MKKLKIFLLTLLMVITLLPVNTIAAGEQTTAPDVTVYATKEQLMDGTFAPNENGVPENIGKIVFGKNNTGALQEWYILGKDDGIKNDEGKVIDNTVIFAANPILTNQVFDYEEGGAAEKNDPSLWSDCDYNDSEIMTVYPNHYGASDLRAELKTITNETSYFTTAEQNIMNATTITTYDSRNNTSYTTTDKLYVLEKGESKTIIEAGSGNKKLLAMSSYWNNGGNFWLRTPTQGSDHTFNAISGDEYDLLSIDISINIRPASNLNLTDVLFASAAKEESSGALASNAAMYLRFDGSNNESLGSICYTDDEIYVHGTGECELFVQGKNGNQNWAYSRTNPGVDNIINKQIIIDELQSLNITDIDLSQCKIWIETKENNVIYAVEAKKAISSVDINIDVPVDGENLDQTPTTKTSSVTVDSISWDTSDTTTTYDKKYKASLTLSPKDGYEFLYHYSLAEDGFVKTSVKVNGNEISNSNITIKSDGKLVVTYEFDTLDTLIRVCDVDTIEVANGTSLEDIKAKLPIEVDVETTNQGIKKQTVSWNPNADLFTSYDPNIKDEQVFEIYGGVTLDNTIKQPSANEVVAAKIKVIVNAAEVVPPVTPAPTSTPAPTVVTTTTDDGYVVPNTGVK